MAEQAERKPAGAGRSGWGKRILAGTGLIAVAIPAALYFIPTNFYVASYGNILSARDAVIRAGSKGPIEAILLESGDRVTEGQVILRLSCEVERSEVVRCERELAQQTAELQYLERKLAVDREQEDRELTHARIQLADAEREYQRVSTLHEQLVASETEFNQAKAAYDLASAVCDRLAVDRAAMREAMLDVQRKKINMLEAELERARGELTRRSVAAPLDGVIVLHSLGIGRVVDADEVLGQIFDDRYHQVVARAPERHVRYLQTGQSTSVVLSAYPEIDYGVINGEVYWVSPVVNPQGSGDGTILVKARLSEIPPHVRLTAGMAAKLSVHVGQTNYLFKLIGILPRDRVQQDGNQRNTTTQPASGG